MARLRTKRQSAGKRLEGVRARESPDDHAGDHQEWDSDRDSDAESHPERSMNPLGPVLPFTPNDDEGRNDRDRQNGENQYLCPSCQCAPPTIAARW